MAYGERGGPTWFFKSGRILLVGTRERSSQTFCLLSSNGGTFFFLSLNTHFLSPNLLSLPSITLKIVLFDPICLFQALPNSYFLFDFRLTTHRSLDLMTSPLLDVEGGGQGNESLMNSASTMESVFQMNPGLTERNYLGLSDCSSVDSSAVSGISEVKRNNLNLKATELRLGLPGSQSPGRDSDIDLASSTCLDEKLLFPLLPSKDGICSGPQKIVVSGNKRGFSDTVDEGNWMFGSSMVNSDASKSLVQGKFTSNASVNGKISSGTQPAMIKDATSKMVPQEQAHATYGASLNKVNASNPAAKTQVVGWPPVRSFRKNIIATNSKNNDEVDGKPGPSALFVKVSMDGAPYLRKVDLRSYTTYQQLSSALEKMFSCFTIGQCGSQGASGRGSLSESKLRDLLHGSEYVLTFEDKDGDWMLVGDVPWNMFIGSCKRLKIMKGSDAIGLAPRAMEKSKNRS
ncbi:hypothetical protein SSX86_025249 [Deinandra increscens subsp. villosa]|uniref:Auxin-responsive protein n=1 Tax=Deinandra increscens subsp. villosa TaxID=3103831 RepID=A0AAP0CI70_9ASTR